MNIHIIQHFNSTVVNILLYLSICICVCVCVFFLLNHFKVADSQTFHSLSLKHVFDSGQEDWGMQVLGRLFIMYTFCTIFTMWIDCFLKVKNKKTVV